MTDSKGEDYITNCDHEEHEHGEDDAPIKTETETDDTSQSYDLEWDDVTGVASFDLGFRGGGVSDTAGRDDCGVRGAGAETVSTGLCAARRDIRRGRGLHIRP